MSAITKKFFAINIVLISESITRTLHANFWIQTILDCLLKYAIAYFIFDQSSNSVLISVINNYIIVNSIHRKICLIEKFIKYTFLLFCFIFCFI